MKLAHSQLAWVVILLSGLLFSAPLFLNDALPWGSDARFHSQLAHGVQQGLADGHVYPRWISEANRGYGSPALIHYSPLGSYWSVLFASISGDLFSGMRVGIVLSAILSGFAFLFAARAFAPPVPAAFGAALYVLFPYHAIDLYERFALAEYHAFVLVPLVFRFAHDLCLKGGTRSFIGFSVSYAGLVLTHVLMAYMALFLLAPFAWLLCPAERRPRAAGALLGGGLVALALAGAYFVPLIAERSLTHADHLLSSSLTSYERNFVWVDEVGRGFGRSRVKPWVNTSLVLQALPVLVALLAIPRRWSPGWIFAVLFGLSILLQTLLATPLYALVPGMSMIGFPWRFQLFQSFFGLLVVVWALREPRAIWVWASIAITALLALNLSRQATSTRPYILDSARFESEGVAGWVQKEHVPLGVPGWKRFSSPQYPVWDERLVIQGGRIEARALEWSSHARRIEVDSPAGGRLSLRTFVYPGWVATLDGEPIAIERDSQYGSITVAIPPGSHRLQLEFRSTWDRRIGAALGTTTALGLVILAGWSWRRQA